VGLRGPKPGHKVGGRKKGTPNKVTTDVAEKLRKLGCDPIEGMALIALGRDAQGNPIDVSIDLKAKMNAELAQYILPKRKALEHSGPGGEPLAGTASWLPPLAK
jgi:hypothetical protein